MKEAGIFRIFGIDLNSVFIGHIPFISYKLLGRVGIFISYLYYKSSVLILAWYEHNSIGILNF
ncbi:MAG: hypothetical protein PHP46_00015 [Candidatus Omnitrophica bacterium]|nr:hypothetical protein [Candidatus Omnitrophota bacterium]